MDAVARESESGDILISKALADAMIERKFKSYKGLGFYTAKRFFTPYKKTSVIGRRCERHLARQ
jgi:hypothetical protein